MRLQQAVAVALPRKAVAYVACHERQQPLVVRSEADLRAVALHRDHAHHFVVTEQRNTQPAIRLGTELAHVAARDQLVDLRAGRQQRLAAADGVLGQAAAERARGAHPVELVHRIDEIQPVALFVDQRDVKVAGVQQAADHPVHFGMEHCLAAAVHRQFRDIEQRRLQRLGAPPFLDLLLQAGIGPFQFQRAPLHVLLQLHVRLAPVHRGQDVLGHEIEHGPVLVAVLHATLVALHHDRAAHGTVAPHRHAQPVGAVRAAVHRMLPVQHLQQLARGAMHRLAQAQHREGQAVLHFLEAETLLRMRREVVQVVREVQEAQAALVLVAFDDVAVVRIHQRAQDAVELGQHLRHFQVAAGEVGDLEQGPLQALGAFELFDLHALPQRHQHRRDQGVRGTQPGLPLCLGEAGIDLGQHHDAGTVVTIGPAFHQRLPQTIRQWRTGQQPAHRPAQSIGPRADAIALPEHRIVPGQGHGAALRQQAVQRRHHAVGGRIGVHAAVAGMHVELAVGHGLHACSGFRHSGTPLSQHNAATPASGARAPGLAEPAPAPVRRRLGSGVASA